MGYSVTLQYMYTVYNGDIYIRVIGISVTSDIHHFFVYWQHSKSLIVVNHSCSTVLCNIRSYSACPAAPCTCWWSFLHLPHTLPRLWITTILFSSLRSTFWLPHISWEHLCLSFNTHMSFNMVFSSFIHVAANHRISFSVTDWYFIVYMYCIFFTRWSADGHLGRLHILPIVNSECGARWHTNFSYFGYTHIPDSGIARLYCSSISRFLRSCHTIFQTGILLYFPTNSMRVSFSPQTSPAFVIFFCF